jgi:hypothetical protein
MTCRMSSTVITKIASASVAMALRTCSRLCITTMGALTSPGRIDGRCSAPLHRVLRVKPPAKKSSDNILIARNEEDRFLLELEGITFNDKGEFVNKGKQVWTFKKLENILPPASYAYTKGDVVARERCSDQEPAGIDNEEDGIGDGRDSTSLNRKRASS